MNAYDAASCSATVETDDLATAWNSIVHLCVDKGRDALPWIVHAVSQRRRGIFESEHDRVRSVVGSVPSELVSNNVLRHYDSNCTAT